MLLNDNIVLRPRELSYMGASRLFSMMICIESLKLALMVIAVEAAMPICQLKINNKAR